MAPGEEAGHLVERDRGELGPELLVDLVADGGRPGRVQLADGLLEKGVDGGVGELAEVAATAGPVDVLAAGDREGVAEPVEVGDVEVALGEPVPKQRPKGGVGQA